MLPFDPKSGEHAIVEVVFGLQFSRPWQPFEIETLANNHDHWRDDLPRLARHEVQQIVVGEGVQQTFTLPGGPGISFERIKPNGDIAWRLRCEGNSLFVNCLEYSRWKEVWAKSSQYIRSVVELIGPEKLSVAGALLQYIDMFDWIGERAEYDVFQLLSGESPHVPAGIGEYGMAWHLHQGWFTELPGPIDGRLLQKAHLDALPNNEKSQPNVKLDTLMRADFSGRVSAQRLFDDKSPIDGTFIEMHDANKHLLTRLLTPEMCERIGLNQ